MKENKEKSFEIEIDINAKISTVLIGADESIIGINLPTGYSLDIINLEDYAYKNKIMTAENKLSSKYHFAKLMHSGSETVKILCLEKTDNFKIVEKFEGNTVMTISKDSSDESKKFGKYTSSEFDKIDCFISALKVFKAGDIAINEVFMTFKWKMFIMNNNFDKNTIVEDANTLCQDTYTLNSEEIVEFNKFYLEFKDSYSLLKNIISNFTYSSKLLSIEKASEVLVTTLEMSLLGKNQQGKKEVLSKRVSAFLSDNDNELINTYNFIKTIYKKRSDSTHEGVIDNVTNAEYKLLEETTRRVICKLIKYIIYETQTQKASYKEVRSELITFLKNKVTQNVNMGLLPR